jgi:hypothetical protein
MAEIACPGCGTVSHYDELRRAASEFCRTCDYPLFWARSTVLPSGTEGSDGDTGLRRLPGAAGRVAVANLDCWSCREPNLLTAIVCVRCGADLSGPPPAPEPIPVTIVQEVVAPPPPPKPSIWPWVVLIVLFVVGLVLLLVLL